VEDRPSGDWLEIVREIKRGAEAIIYEGRLKDLRVVIKRRVRKPYRHPQLDHAINSERTAKEARLMYLALKAGVNVPAVILALPPEYTLVMEYVEGTLLRDSLKPDRKLGEMIGEMVGKLHRGGIAHGDLTTANMILTPQNELFLIDFGLAKRSDDLEDHATDVHLFMRALESAHPEAKDVVMQGFVDGYSIYVSDYRDVMEKVKEIRMRGRYVEERRKGSHV
jgi:TP53 regulating kinase-like protein